MQSGATEPGFGVLQVLPSLISGDVERGVVDLAEAIAAAGGRAAVASEGGAMERQLTRVGAKHVRLPLASNNPLVMRANVARLAAAIEAQRADIVHAHAPAPAWSAAAAAQRSGRALVTTFHEAYGTGNPFQRRYVAVMARGDRVIAPSEFIAQHLRQTHKIDLERLKVVPRGVDLGIFDPARVSSERFIALSRRFRLPDGVPVVMLPGCLTRGNGQALLLEALNALSDLNFCCLLVDSDQGQTSYRRELEAQIARRELTSRAVIFDGCNDMPAAYMLADVVVSASAAPEAFGRVIAEAQAMGRPVVAAEHGGAREQMSAGETAFPFPPGQAYGLTQALRQALSLDTGARERLAAAAVAQVRAGYSKELMCRRTLDVYAELPRPDALTGGIPPKEAVSAKSGA